MSAPDALVAKLGAILSASPPTVAIVLGGLILGALGGAALTSSARIPASGPGGPLDLLSCPDNGVRVARLDPGQRVLTVGRTADGRWVALHDPLPGREVSWAPVAAMHFEGDPSTLPVMACDSPAESFLAAATLTAVANNSPSASPTPTVTSTAAATAAATATAGPVVTSNPTTRPTARPTSKPTATPTPPPDTTKPTLRDPYRQYAGIYESGCSPTATSIRVTATDASGIKSVSLLYRYQGATRFSRKAMSARPGTSRYSTSLSTIADGLHAGQIQYYFSATDNAGNTAVLYQSFFLLPNYFDLTIYACVPR